MFIGRTKELQDFGELYSSGRPEVVIVYGRRRVGKTTLLEEFCRDKRSVFFSASEANADENLRALSDAISLVEDLSTDSRSVFSSFQDALRRIAELSRDGRLVFVIDEYPYLAKSYPGFSSLLQNFLDHQAKGTKLFLLLCGSSMSFMENQVLGYKSPLYGRRTAQFKIMPFDYRETGLWFPRYSYEDRAVMYGVTGGVPMYLSQFSESATLQENLLRHYFRKSAMLFEEPDAFLKQELREPATYKAIIQAIAEGKTKLSEIAATAGLATGLCVKYIANLISLGLVRRETPVTEPCSKRPIYQLDDLFYRFWYTFIPRNRARIDSGRFERSYKEQIEEHIPEYMGLVFERMCRDYLLYYDEGLPFQPEDIGRWWGGNPHTHKQAEIDIVMPSYGHDSVIVGSCKFRNQPTGVNELDLLESYAEAMGGFADYYYYIFSKSGFSAELRKRESERVRLITIQEIYES